MYHVNYMYHTGSLFLSLFLSRFNDFLYDFSSECKIKKIYDWDNWKWNQNLMHHDSMFLMICMRSIHNQIQFLYIQSPNS